MSWSGKKVLVLGAGESGLSMARHLAGVGAALRVADTRENPPGAQALVDAVPEVETVWGAFTPAMFEGVDAVAVSPGVPVSGPLADPVVLEARATGLPFVGDVELFAQAIAAEKEANGYAPKILAITGTNGKTTVTALTTFLAKRAGKRATYAGNISPAALDAWHAAKEAGSLPDIWVLELSSYQLETTSTLVPDAAVMLNLTEDHLDRHGSMEEYAAAKARIFAAGGLQILNRDDPASLAMRRPFVPKGKKDAPPIVITFGTSEPQSEYEYGLVREARPGGITWLTEGTPDGPKRLMPADVLKIKGQHNALNALAALALNRSLGLNLAPMIRALTEYAGEPHRVQTVAEVNGVTYIDDSKGTNVGATLAALNGLGSELRDGRKLVLIAGGDGKGQNFEPLALPVAVYCRAVMLIGRDAPAIEQALLEAGTPMTRCESLQAAVKAAAGIAQSGDLVLLSPACASLDMFRNYAHRADVFTAAVRSLGREDGEGDAPEGDAVEGEAAQTTAAPAAAPQEVAAVAPQEVPQEEVPQELAPQPATQDAAAEAVPEEVEAAQDVEEVPAQDAANDIMVEAVIDEPTPEQDEVAMDAAEIASSDVSAPAETGEPVATEPADAMPHAPLEVPSYPVEPGLAAEMAADAPAVAAEEIHAAGTAEAALSSERADETGAPAPAAMEASAMRASSEHASSEDEEDKDEEDLDEEKRDSEKQGESDEREVKEHEQDEREKDKRDGDHPKEGGPNG